MSIPERRDSKAVTLLLTGMMITISIMMVFGNGQVIGTGYDDARMEEIFDILNDQGTGPFVENGGQWDDAILFAARTSFGHLAFGRDIVLFNVRGEAPEDRPMEKDPTIQGSVIIMTLVGTNGVEPVGRETLPYRTNIFNGRDPSGWGTDLLTYRSVVYEDLWDGIDLVYTSSNSRIKYEYVVDPFSDPDDIRFDLSGLDGIKAEDDHLEMMTENGVSLVDDGLVSFYRGSTSPLETSFEMRVDGTIGYRVSGRDPSRTLVIDPVIYSTYIGGGDSEGDADMILDPDGACYLAGSTFSFDFPTTSGAYNMKSSGDMDGFVMKIYPDGSSPVYSTYVGGSNYDHIFSLDIDDDGNAFVGGFSSSVDFPTTRGAFNETLNGSESDLVVFKLDSTGSDLVYSTYIGGNGSDAMENRGMIRVDGSGSLHLAGTSWSGNFPVTDDAFDRYNNESGGDEWKYRNGKVVLVKLSADGSTLLYSTYIGGIDWDNACGLDLDGYGMAYVIGSTSSYDFPTTEGAFDTSLDSWSGIFVLKFDIGRSSLVYSTFLNGGDYQMATDVEVDGSGRAYVTGYTGSSDFPVIEGSYQDQIMGWDDVFVTAFDPTGSSLYISTFIGGSESDQARGLDLDPDGNILVTGLTYSYDFPQVVINKDDTTDRDPDMFIAKLDSTASELSFSTVIGGALTNGYPEDVGFTIYHSGERRVAVAGGTGSTDFPVSEDAWDDTMTDWYDLFLLEFDISLPPAVPTDLALFQGDGYLNLSWGEPLSDGGMPVTGYAVFRGESEDILDLLAYSIGGLFYNDTDLDMGTTYYYTVCAFNAVGTGLSTDILHSLAASSPTPPQFFRVQKGNGWVKLTWEPPIFDGSYALEGYRVYRSVDGVTTATELESFRKEYTDTDVINGWNYSYFVTTWNIIGESDPTAEHWVIPQGGSSPPLDLAAENGTGWVRLTWSPPEDDGGSKVLFYRVHIGVTLSEELLWRYVEVPAMEYTDDLVEIGRTYLYFITAVNSEGESAPSAQVEGLPRSEPSSPVNMQILERNEYLIINWEMPSYLGGIDLLGYRLYRSQEGEGPFMVVELGYDEFTYKDENVTNGITYTYTILAFNSFGSSEETSALEGTPATVPDSPLGLTAVSGDGEVEVSWAAPSSDGGVVVIEYLIFRKVGDELQEIDTVTAGTMTYSDTDVVGGTVYTYSVKARNRMGPSQFGQEASAMALGAPGEVPDLILSSGDGFVDISWSAPVSDGGSAVTGYVVYRAGPDLQDMSVAVELDAMSTSYRDADVVNGEEYVYSVNAVNVIGESIPEWSDPVFPLGVPGTVLSLVLTADGSKVSISWSAPSVDGGSAIVLYRIYRMKGDDAPVRIGSVEYGVLSFIDDEKKDDGTYTYLVFSVNLIGESKAGAQESIEVRAEEEGSNILAEKGPLFVTLPIIVILLALLIFVSVRRRGAEAVPSDQPAEAAPYEEEPLAEEIAQEQLPPSGGMDVEDVLN